MIIGIGIDICGVSRIRQSLARFGDAYLSELFSSSERLSPENRIDPAEFYARAFCGKEACAKALGVGISTQINWLDIEILQTRASIGIRLSNGALKRLVRLGADLNSVRLSISCTNNETLAHAFVVISE